VERIGSVGNKRTGTNAGVSERLRNLLSFVSVVSLLLGVLTAAAWVRSYWSFGSIHVQVYGRALDIAWPIGRIALVTSSPLHQPNGGPRIGDFSRPRFMRT
jgi:uncharacterized protein (DUF697 family)